MSQYRCLQSWCPLRKEPSSASEMTSSLLFGETCTVLEEQEEFMRVRCDHDQYEGWVSRLYVEPVQLGEAFTTRVITRGQYLESDRGERIDLSPGSLLPPGDYFVSQDRGFQRQGPLSSGATLVELAQSFLYTPYLWGGRGLFGIDCSGLIQVLGSLIGESMPRDAWQQALMGNAKLYRERQAGDLAYFHNQAGKITHVGLLIDPDRILHAYGRVRVDALTPEGIVQKSGSKPSHRLADIRSWR
ncbi:MAG: NlpC/P60 family protein [Bacteroidia bacterium]